MRKLLAVVLFVNIILISKGQNLTVEGTAPDLYVTHTVAPKENFYSIGRMYNQPPKTIAALNNIVMEKGLTIGQQIKIPLDAQNIDASENTKAGSIALTHTVAKSETLFKIAQDNHVTAQQMRKWNSLSSDHITPGTSVIIGHLKAGDGSTAISPAKKTPAVDVTGNAPATQPAETAQSKADTKQETTQNGAVSVNNDSAAENGKTTKESTDVQSTPNEKVSAKTAEQVLEKDTALAVIPEKTTETNTNTNTAKEAPAKQPEVSSAKADKSKKAEQPANETGDAADGAFANLFNVNTFEKSITKKSGDAATFKSTSGWQDKKYYALVSNITPGTILKISSAENKVVYAKVLGSMPEMKENNGLLLRLSSAAASSLGIIDPKFSVQISYYK